MKVDWNRKLTSRKFWVSITAFISMMIIAMGGSEDRATQITSLIMAGATAVAYTLGEGFIDAKEKNNDYGQKHKELQDK